MAQTAIDNSSDRLTRLIERFQASTLGKELYAFAQKENVTISFAGKEGGFYDPASNAIGLNPRFTDDDLLATLAHELRHAWQYKMAWKEMPPLAPKDLWTAHGLREADSCAFAVHFAAEYVRETGVQLTIQKPTYEGRLIRWYLSKPEGERDFSTPLHRCLDDNLITKTMYSDNYDTSHAIQVRDTVNSLQNRFNWTVQHNPQGMDAFYKQNLAVPNTDDVTAFYRRLFSRDLTPSNGYDAVKNLSNADFRSAITGRMKSAYDADMEKLEVTFADLQQRAKAPLPKNQTP